jgi:hypothetical protein
MSVAVNSLLLKEMRFNGCEREPDFHARAYIENPSCDVCGHPFDRDFPGFTGLLPRDAGQIPGNGSQGTACRFPE